MLLHSVFLKLTSLNMSLLFLHILLCSILCHSYFSRFPVVYLSTPRQTLALILDFQTSTPEFSSELALL